VNGTYAGSSPRTASSSSNSAARRCASRKPSSRPSSPPAASQRAGRVLLRDYAEQRWLPAQVHLRPNTQDLYRQHLKNHVLPAFGTRAVGTLRRPDMKAFVAELSTKLAPATVHTVYGVLRSIMQSAVDDEVIPANPCSRVPLPRVDPRVIDPLAPEAVLALMDAITPRYRVSVLLAAGAGLREGEALGLLVARIDFLRRRIHVEQQLTGDGTAPLLSPLKTRASRRIVPVDDVVLEGIAEHIRKFPPSPEGFLITNRLRKPVRRSSFGNRWKLAAAKAGLPKGTRFHDLRRFYASTLVAANLHPKTIRARLGHASIVETSTPTGISSRWPRRTGAAFLTKRSPRSNFKIIRTIRGLSDLALGKRAAQRPGGGRVGL
jgi:integrase